MSKKNFVSQKQKATIEEIVGVSPKTQLQAYTLKHTIS